MKTRKRAAKGLLAAAAFGAAAFLAAELGVRVLHPMDALVYQDSDDPTLATELRPGASGLKNGVEVSISAQGLRDEPVASPRPPGERRVVVVGGQETFGVGVPVEKTYVRELSEGLVAPGQGRARTINLSMYSYSLSQKVELACRRLKELEPELAVLQVTDGESLSPMPALLRFPRFKNWIRARSALIRWASERYYLRGKKGPPPAPPDLELVGSEIRGFEECAGAAGARAAIVLLPDLSEFPPAAPSAFHRKVESVSREGGMPFIDAAPALDAVPVRDRLLFPGAPYLSPAAHRALSDELRRKLKPLLKRTAPPAKSPPRRPVA